MNSFVTDTHALAWYLTNDNRISNQALEILLDAEKGNAVIFVPAIVLAELLHISEKKRIQIDYKTVFNTMKDHPNFIIIPLDISILERMIQLSALY